MKKSKLLVVFSVALSIGVLWLVVGHAPRARADGGPAGGGDVVMIRCSTSGFAVTGYRGSSNTPAKKSDSCPEVLSLLTKEGFGIVEPGYRYGQDFIVYTLTR